MTTAISTPEGPVDTVNYSTPAPEDGTIYQRDPATGDVYIVAVFDRNPYSTGRGEGGWCNQTIPPQVPPRTPISAGYTMVDGSWTSG